MLSFAWSGLCNPGRMPPDRRECDRLADWSHPRAVLETSPALALGLVSPIQSPSGRPPLSWLGRLSRTKPGGNPREDLLDWKPLRPPQSTFPNHQCPPTRRFEVLAGPQVSGPVPLDLGSPELRPGSGGLEHRAAVPVPETAVDENNSIEAWEH
jgi:hypothetical protein